VSGGPYGRGKAPERACMKVALWPVQDRMLWFTALAPTDPFEAEGGACSGNLAISNQKTEKGYGRWLTWLTITGQLNQALPPDERITRDRVLAYIAHLAEIGNSTRTILCRLQELGDMARVLAPNMSSSFIKRIASYVRARHTPARDKRSRLAMTDELVALGMQLMASAETEPTPRLAGMAFRDGLVIALLALRPLRRKNLAELVIDLTLCRLGNDWVIRPKSMKTRTPIECLWPEVLVPALTTYLAVHRPCLTALRGRWAAPIGDALWVSAHGSPMTQMALYDIICARTRPALGKAVNPHRFRDSAATTMAVEDPDHVRLVSSLLGHRSTATTERYYQQAQSLDAHRRYLEVIQ